jgi:hypothetical protein
VADRRARLATKQRALALEPVDACDYLKDAGTHSGHIRHGERVFWGVWEV